MKNKKETAQESTVQEQNKCKYLGCNNIRIILDDVEVSTNVIEKRYVYSKHVVELSQRIIYKGIN